MAKKLISIALLAVVMSVLLAISSMAIGLKADGTLAGLKSGASYVANSYDIRNNTTGSENIAVDKSTVLDAGIWAITTPTGVEYVFIPGEGLGTFNFMPEDDSYIAYSGDRIVSGKWNYTIDGASTDSRFIATANGIQIDVRKSGLEYIASTGATYGFAEEQIMPAKMFNNWSFDLDYTSFEGKYADGYSVDDVAGKVVYYLKTPGSDEITTEEFPFEVDAVADSYMAIAPESFATSDAYLVGITVLPWGNTSVDIFGTLHRTNNFAQLNFFPDNLSVVRCAYEYAEDVPEANAPTGITGGYGVVLGLDDTQNYEIAPVTLNATGDGYAVGEWTAVTSETTGLAGLNVVRYVSANGVVSEPSDIFYITGNADDRQALGNLTEAGRIAFKSGTTTWVPGYICSKICGCISNTSNVHLVYGYMSTLSEEAQSLWLYQKTEAEAESKLAEDVANNTSNNDSSPEVMQGIIDAFYTSKSGYTASELNAEKIAIQEKIANSLESIRFKYAFDETEIIPVDEATSISLASKKHQGSISLTGRMIAVFKVMNEDGNVTDYPWYSESTVYGYTSSVSSNYCIDLKEVFDGAEGYLVGFELFPIGDIDVSTIVADSGRLYSPSLTLRFYMSVWQAGWYTDSYIIKTPTYPKPEGITGGNGVIEGLVPGCEYQYAEMTLNSTGDALAQGEWTDLTAETELAGLYVVRQVINDGYSEASDMVYVYGDYEVRQELGSINASTGKIDVANTKDFVTGKWTGYGAASHTTFPTYGISSYGQGWIMSAQLKAVTEAETTLAELKAAAEPDADAIAAAEATVIEKRTAISNVCVNNWLYYSYTPDEIVNINELKTFKFKTAVRQGIGYTESYTSNVELYIASLDGAVSTYAYTTVADNDGATRTIDFTDATAWTPALPTEGYVVGIKIDQWSGKTNPMAWSIGNVTYNTIPMLTLLPDEYEIVDPDADLTDISGKDGHLEGLDPDKSYEAAALTINADGTGLTKGEYVAVDSSTELAGLYVVREVADGVYSADSEMIYVPGDANKINELGQLSALNGLVAFASGTNFVTGKWTGTVITTHSSFGKWTLGSHSQVSLSKDPDEATAKGFVDKTNAIQYLYAYESDEIIPVSEALSFTLKITQNNAHMKFKYLRTKVIAYVASIDGTVTPYEKVLNDIAFETKYNYTHTQTVDFTEFLPEEGYLVGIKIFPATEIKYDEFVEVVYSGNMRFLVNVDPANYVIHREGFECGDGVYWYFNEDTGVLTISGVGEMYDYDYVSDVPWYDISDDITSVVISHGVTHIGNNSLSYIDGLTSITLPNSVVTLGEYAFYSCEYLTTVKMSANLETIGYGAFESCESLASVTFPATLRTIEGDAFSSCYSLETVKLPVKLETIGSYAFYDCSALTSITVYPATKTIEEDAFYGCDELTMYGYAGSYAETYAEENDIPFEYLACETHTFGEWVYDHKPTCTDEGLKTRTCTLCRVTEEETVAATGHSYTAVTTAPTCTEDGYTTHTCSACGDSYTTAGEKAKGHSYGEWVTVKEPTATESGCKRKTCSACNYTFDEILPALGNGEATATFTLSDVVAKPGETIKVYVSLTSTEKINSIALAGITYDSNLLEFIGFGDHGHLDDITALPPAFDTEKMTFVIALEESTAFNGQLCSLEFKVRESAGDCVTSVTATPLTKNDGTTFTSSSDSGDITVRTYLLGDIEMDEDVDVDDAVRLFQHSMFPQLYPITYPGDTDFDGDGNLDLQDALAVFRYSMLPDVYPLG